MANKYWVGGTGAWSDIAHWSTTSGGSGGASAPTSADDVYFDSNSSSGAFTVSIGAAVSCNAFNCSSLSKAMTIVASTSSTPTLSVSGDVTLSSFLTLSSSVFWQGLRLIGSTPQSVTTNGATIDTSFSIRSTSTVTLNDSLTARSFTLHGGLLVTQDYNITSASNFYINPFVSAVTANLGTSTIECTTLDIRSGVILNAESSTINIKVPNTFNNFSSTGYAFGTVNIKKGTGNTLGAIWGDNSFSTLTIESGMTVSFRQASEQTISSFTANNVVLRSDTDGTQFTLNSPNDQTIQGADIKDSNATGGGTWTNIAGINSGNNNGWIFTIPPTVTTGTASGTTTNSFTISGSGVTSNPDSQTITEYGIAYATTTSPTINDNTQVGTGTEGSFNATISGLSENTTYYARAYAKYGTSVAYGSQISHKTQGRPTVVLDSPADTGSVSSTKPQLKFTGTDADNNSITYQIQINTSSDFSSPLIDKASATDAGFSNLSTVKTDPFYSGNQIGYTLQTDLTRGQTYYWRVRGKDSSGSNTFGEWATAKSFTVSAVAPTLTTVGAHDIDFDSAEVDAVINSDGGAEVTERGVVYSTAINPTISDNKVIFDDSSDITPNEYTVELTGLTGSTTYYARAYAINSAGTSYGNSISFQTSQTPGEPTVVTGAAANTTDITSDFNGSEVTLDGTFAVTERGIVFSDTNTTPDTDDRKIVAPTSGLGSYDLSMTGLDPETTYYVRAYAVNSFGTGYGEVETFTTAAPYVPDEGDGYWNWAPGQSQATVGRTQPTQAHSSVNLPLENLGLEDGQQYTFYFGGVDFDNGAPRVTIERYNGETLIEDVIAAGVPFTFTYDEDYIHWNIRLFVTDENVEADNITAVFNDLYLAKESEFSGYVPFVRRGVTEVKIINNEIVDDRRQDVISTIYDQVEGVSWYPFNIDTEGLGYFEIGDRITIQDDQGDEKSVVIWNTKLTIDGGIDEKLYTNKPDLTETDYSKAGNSRLRGNLKNTQLQVDKQRQEIEALVSNMYDIDGIVNTKFSEVKQDVNSVVTTVQGAGGVNLIRNSVMYAFDESGLPDSWEVDESDDGTLTIQASPESLAAGAVSGNQFSLSGKAVSQTVTVRKDVDFIDEEDKTYYSISARVKKNTVGAAYIQLSNRNETLTIELPDQTSYFWEVVKLEEILPKDDHYVIEIYSDSDADLQVTDLILAPGKTRHEWAQANGEVMNSSVAITKDGITVRSSSFQNNYTKIDALGFEVHKKEVGGDRIFGFNDDETNVSKLKSDKQIGMPPMRVVPISFGTYSGWAFTPSEEDS